MHFNLFILSALVAAASAQPTEVSKANDVFARDEYRWCLGTKPLLPSDSSRQRLTISQARRSTPAL
jgi:hypothetical protein